MNHLRRISILVITLAIILGGLGFSAEPARAASCQAYHVVKSGETLYSIGVSYSLSWKDIAAANGINTPYTIYTGQSLCIPSGGVTVSYPDYWKNWQFRVIRVKEDTSVTIQTSAFPDNMLYKVEIGCSACELEPIKVTEIDSDAGGIFKKVFRIPIAFAAENSLWLRLTQVNNGDARQVAFTNASGAGDCTACTVDTDYCVPTIAIVSVVEDSTVTIRTANFPTGLTFNVRMGVMGSRGVSGYLVGSFASGDGSSQTLTFTIPSDLQGLSKIAIRTENLASGYYSYNWFYNNTAY